MTQAHAGPAVARSKLKSRQYNGKVNAQTVSGSKSVSPQRSRGEIEVDHSQETQAEWAALSPDFYNLWAYVCGST
jgi:hypothetical protein